MDEKCIYRMITGRWRHWRWSRVAHDSSEALQDMDLSQRRCAKRVSGVSELLERESAGVRSPRSIAIKMHVGQRTLSVPVPSDTVGLSPPL